MNIDAPKLCQISDLRDLWQEAFGDTEQFLDDFFSSAFSRDRCRCVEIDGTIAAALYWFDCSCDDQRIAYLYAIATAKAYRGQGLCRKLMDDTHHHLRSLGYDGALLVPSSKELFVFYERGGYTVCSCIGALSCFASQENISLNVISSEEYAIRRRNFLPENGVIQEEENLRFLQTQVSFYTTASTLLAARREGNTLYGAELLGDISQAPAITGALSCTAGKFRIAEGDTPFAMYYPLTKTALPPSYFGLAFD